MSAQAKTYTSLERVLAALGFREADRVPFFLLLTTHGARELGMSIRDYFSDPGAIAEGQLRMRRRYGHDCLYGFTYAGAELEAWGGQVSFTDDGPPNSASVLASEPEDVDRLEAPPITGSAVLRRGLEAIRLMREGVGLEAPIIGVVMSPFSLPVMQLGFQAYLDLIHDDRERFWRLMAKNEDFCVRWANAQLEAGATAICYFDPVSSTDMVPRPLYLETGHPIARRTVSAIKGPTATHFASGRSLSLVDDIAGTGTSILGLSAAEDLAASKRACAGRLSLLGNLNGVTMRSWSRDDAEREVKKALRAGAPGGGFILSDNHGEIHWSVPERVLDDIADAARAWGRYPLDWIG